MHSPESCVNYIFYLIALILAKGKLVRGQEPHQWISVAVTVPLHQRELWSCPKQGRLLHKQWLLRSLSTAHSWPWPSPVLQHLYCLCSWCPRAAPLSPPALTPLSPVPGVPAMSLPCGKPLDLLGWQHQCQEQHLPLQCGFGLLQSRAEPNPLSQQCVCVSARQHES